MMEERCWNCGALGYVETAAIEYCPHCEVRCDYHGDGANELYDQAMERKWADERAARERTDRDEEHDGFQSAD